MHNSKSFESVIENKLTGYFIIVLFSHEGIYVP